MWHGTMRGHSARLWEEIWLQLIQNIHKVCFIMPVYFREIILWNREWSSDIESACGKAYILDWSISAVSAAFIKQD